MIAEPKKITQHFYHKVIFWFGGALATTVTALSLVQNPTQTIIALLLIGLFGITFKNPRIGVHVALLLPLFGELVRLPFGPSGGILVSDALIPVFIAAWVARNIFNRERGLPKSKLTLPIILFIAIATLSLIQSLTFLSFAEAGSGTLYLIRFSQYALLYFITLQTITTPEQKKAIIRTMIISAFLLAIAGFVQLGVYPNLAALEEQGYDPHINRLVSVWLDPNFVGGFLAFIISIMLGISLHSKNPKTRAALFLLIAILGAALFLTYSRSAYLALAAGIFIISLLRSQKILLITIALFLLGIGISPRAQDRIGELTQSIASLTTSSIDTPDPTAKLRIESWQQTWTLIQKRPLLGSGYNNLRTVNHQEGFISDQEGHSASGSDSSLLTILATTGIVGLIPFLYIYFSTIISSFKTWRSQKETPLNRGYALGILGGIFALLTHSIFVNSLLFAPILIFFWIGLALTNPSTSNANR